MICQNLEACVKQTIVGELSYTCDNGKANCINSSDTRLYIKCEERKKKYTLVNSERKKVTSYHMDGGIVTDVVSKCDYLYAIEGQKPIVILIELKGVDVLKAMTQIDNTLTLFKSFFDNCSNVYGRIVVASAVPKLNANPIYVKLYKKLAKSYKGNLKVGSIQFIEKDTELSTTK